MNRFSSFIISSVTLSSIAQAGSMEEFRDAAAAFSSILQDAVAVLESINSTEMTDAGIHSIEQVLPAQEHLVACIQKLANEGWTPTRLYDEANLANILHTLPIEYYNRLVQQELADGCHGSVKLYLALSGRNGEFTEEQINTPLHHQEAQTLARIAAIFELVKQITSLNPQEYPINLEVELLSRIDEVDPRVTDLQKSPAASLEYTRLVNKAAPVLQNFYATGFHNSGELQKRFMWKADNFFGRLYDEKARKLFFALQTVESFPGSPHYILQELYWKQIAADAARFNQRHHIIKGDGRTPDTAFTLFESMTEEEVFRLLTSFGQEVMGERFILVDPAIVKNSEGKPTFRVISYAGRIGRRHSNNDFMCLFSLYFQLSPQS